MQGIVLRIRILLRAGRLRGFVGLLRKRRLPIIGDGAGSGPFLHIRDAAAATVAALEHGRAGIYNVVDTSRPGSRMAAVSWRRRPREAAPPDTGMARAARRREAAVAAMTQIRGSSNARAKRELGWQPAWRSWRRAFRAGLPPPEPARDAA